MNASVRGAQRRLRLTGYYGGPADNMRGAQTRRAQLDFCAAQGLKGLCKKRAARVQQEAVAHIQRLLNGHGADIAVCGEATEETVRALKVFQRRMGLAPDGVAAGKTLALLHTAPGHILRKDDYFSAHFAKSEFTCRCGAASCPRYPDKVDMRLIVALEALRSAVNKRYPLGLGYERAVTVREGYRCAALNEALGGGGAEPLTRGRAAVISVGGLCGAKVLRVCADLGLNAQAAADGYTKIVITGGSIHERL